jgi:hypothetical protein
MKVIANMGLFKKKYKGKIVLHDTPEMLYEEEPTDDIVLGFILN